MARDHFDTGPHYTKDVQSSISSLTQTLAHDKDSDDALCTTTLKRNKRHSLHSNTLEKKTYTQYHAVWKSPGRRAIFCQNIGPITNTQG